MHPSALEYVARHVRGRCYPLVLEFGSRDVNGSPRTVVTTPTYIGVDLKDGPGVDVVADAASFRLPDWMGAADLVVCCEVLEHTPDVEAIIDNAAANLTDDGRLIVTCATAPRHPHSAVDGGRLRPGEYYENVYAIRLLRACHDAGLKVHDIQRVVLPNHGGDLYLTAGKDASTSDVG